MGEYFSYTNAFNPLPCVEVLIWYAYDMYPISPTTPATVVPWKPEESLVACMESYVGSISAYFGIYLASDLEEIRGDATERDATDVGIFYSAWGLMWIHSAYAMYCLKGTDYGNTLETSYVNPFKKAENLSPALYDSLTDTFSDETLDTIITAFKES